MLTFKQFILLEGGNLTYSDEHGKTVGSDSIHTHERDEYMGHVNGIKEAISGHIGGHPVNAVGSAAHFLDKSISNEDFENVNKKKFGDMDLVLPDHHEVLSKLQELKDHVGKMETATHQLVHVKGSDDPNDPSGLITMWRHKQTGKVIQVDLSPIKHNMNKEGKLEPDEGALWYKQSPKEDMFPHGIGGMGSKIGLRAASQSMRQEVLAKTGKLGKLKRILSGVVVSIGGKTPPGGRYNTKKTGEYHPETGEEIHQELPSSGAERELHPHNIGKMIFGDKFNHKRTDTRTLQGTIAAIKKHGTEEQQGKFVENMTNLLYGEGSQVAARHDKPGGREYDYSKKDPIINLLRQHFPDHPTLSDENMSAMKNEYNARAASRTRK